MPTLRKRLNRRPIKLLAAFLLILLAAQCLTYFAVAQTTLTYASITRLSDFPLLKERCAFAVIDEATWSTLTPAQQSSLTASLHKTVPDIYPSLAAVPDSRKVFAPITGRDFYRLTAYLREPHRHAQYIAERLNEILEGRRYEGLDKGMKFSWQIESSGPFWAKCSAAHHSYSGSFERRTQTFIFLLGFWIPVYTHHHVIT